MAKFIESVDLGHKTVSINDTAYVVEGFCDGKLSGNITVSKADKTGYIFVYDYELLHKHRKHPEGTRLASIVVPNLDSNTSCEFKLNHNISSKFYQPIVNINPTKKYKFGTFERIAIVKNRSKQDDLKQIRQNAIDLLSSEEIQNLFCELFNVKRAKDCFTIYYPKNR